MYVCVIVRGCVCVSVCVCVFFVCVCGYVFEYVYECGFLIFGMFILVFFCVLLLIHVYVLMCIPLVVDVFV